METALSTPTSPTAPYPKWVYDLVLETIWQERSGGHISPTDALRFIPPAMQTACRGILDYHSFPVAGAPTAPPTAPGAPAADPTEPVTTVLPLAESPQAATP